MRFLVSGALLLSVVFLAICALICLVVACMATDACVDKF